METITIKAFKAVDDRVRCARYLLEHIKVLEDIGVASALKPDISWCTDPNVIVIVAEHIELGMVAGMRLHLQPGELGLPMERSLMSIEPTVPERMAALIPEGRAEIAGLWNAHRFAGRGIPLLLISSGVALAGLLGVSALVCVAAEYVVPYTRKVGFSTLAHIGDAGLFCYPLDHMRSFAMIVADPLTLESAEALVRHRILSLRIQPSQRRSEEPKKGRLDVYYDIWPAGVRPLKLHTTDRSHKAA